MNRLITTIVCLLCVVCSQAQTDKEKSRQIIDIQLNTDYIFAEGNGDSEMAALEIASYELLLCVNKLRSSVGWPAIKEKGEVLDPFLTRMISVVRSGARHRVFLYMLKEDAFLLKVSNNDNDNQAEKTNEEPNIDEPVEPSQPVVGNNFTDAVNDNDNQAEKTNEEPNIDEPVEPSQPVVGNKFTDAVFVSDDVHRMLLQAGTLLELSKFMKQYKEEGKISEYQGAMSLNAIPSDSYKMVVDATNQKVMAILTPTNINIQTNKADDISNYHGCSVVWYK